MSLNWILIVVGALLILLEVVLGAVSGFDFLLIGSAILLGGVLGVATKSASIGLATGGILALVYVFVGRKKIRSRLARHNLPSNTDALDRSHGGGHRSHRTPPAGPHPLRG